ncbi:hypothetical protein L195_g063863, partial [Trifolium pratense]
MSLGKSELYGFEFGWKNLNPTVCGCGFDTVH